MLLCQKMHSTKINSTVFTFSCSHRCYFLFTFIALVLFWLIGHKLFHNLVNVLILLLFDFLLRFVFIFVFLLFYF